MQKERERYYLQRARTVYSGFPNAEPVDCEAPDFLFETENAVIGVEFTDFIRGLATPSVTMRTVESLRMRVAERAQRRFEARTGIPVWVALHWNDQVCISKSDVERLSTELANFVELETPAEEYSGAVLDDTVCGDQPLFCAITSRQSSAIADRGVWCVGSN
jgi:hypothetical protein